MEKTLLFVGGGIETLPGVVLAKEMGLRVIVSDRNPDAPCFKESHDHLIADTYNGPETIAALQKWTEINGGIHGVLCLGVDVPLTAALVAQAFGLPGISPESAQLAMDKLAMKHCFAREGVAIPWFGPVTSVAHLAELVSEQKHTLVLKPVDSRGARGVIRLKPQVDLDWAFHYAKKFSPTGRVMAEHYLPGPQISTESLVINGCAYTPGFSDRNYELLERHAPFFIENGGDLPSEVDAETQDQVTLLVDRAARAMGIQNGVVKGDVVVHRGKPYIIELAARLSGGYFCTHSIPLNTGVPIVKYAILQAIGEAVNAEDLVPKYQRHVCQRYFFPKPGKVSNISGFQETAALDYVAYCELRTQPGQVIAPIENHPGRAGVLMTLGATRQEARTRAEAAVRSIIISTVKE